MTEIERAQDVELNRRMDVYYPFARAIEAALPTVDSDTARQLHEARALLWQWVQVAMPEGK